MREIIVRLEDIRQFINEVENMITGIKTFNNYSGSRVYQMAFDREFELIGEALFKIRKQIPDITISNLNNIIALRHLITHEYYEVEHNRIWSFAIKYLSTLKNEIEHLINQENLKLFGTSNPNLD